MGMTKKIINIIAENPLGDIVYTESLRYDPKKMKGMCDVRDILVKKLVWPKTVICGYCRRTQQAMLVHDAKCGNGSIDWALKFHELDFETAFTATGAAPITIIAICYEEDIGLGGIGFGDVSHLAKIFKILAWLFLLVYNYVRPYRTLSKKYDISEAYIQETINRCDKWRVGFISTEDFKYKSVIERSIMRKMSYKKNNRQWEFNRSRYFFKDPYKIFRGEY